MQSPGGDTDAHNQKKEEELQKERKIMLEWSFLVAAILTSPIQYQKFSSSKSGASKKGTVYEYRRRPIVDLRFSPWRSPHPKKNAFNKDIARHNQLRSDLGFLPWRIRLWTSHVQLSPLACHFSKSRITKQVPRRQSPSKFHVVAQTQTTIACPRIFTSMTFSASTMERERAPWY
jgi:hypothetical protein